MIFARCRALSWTYLALNRKRDAINTARRAVELLPLEKDAVLGSGNLAALAEVQAQTGAVKEALANLRDFSRFRRESRFQSRA